MSDITIATPHGDITLPALQAIGIGECMQTLINQGKRITWHVNECGCCYTVHEDTHPITGGYVVGPDGGYDWVNLEGHTHPEKSEGSEEAPE